MRTSVTRLRTFESVTISTWKLKVDSDTHCNLRKRQKRQYKRLKVNDTTGRAITVGPSRSLRSEKKKTGRWGAQHKTCSEQQSIKQRRKLQTKLWSKHDWDDTVAGSKSITGTLYKKEKYLHFPHYFSQSYNSSLKTYEPNITTPSGLSTVWQQERRDLASSLWIVKRHKKGFKQRGAAAFRNACPNGILVNK